MNIILFFSENIVTIFYLLYVLLTFFLLFAIERLAHFVIWHQNVIAGKKNRTPHP